MGISHKTLLTSSPKFQTFETLKYLYSRALCRTKLLPVTHVLVDTWMLIVKPVYKLLNVPDDLKWTTNTHVTPFTLISKAKLTIFIVFEDLFLSFLYLSVTCPPIYLPVDNGFYPLNGMGWEWMNILGVFDMLWHNFEINNQCFNWPTQSVLQNLNHCLEASIFPTRKPEIPEIVYLKSLFNRTYIHTPRLFRNHIWRPFFKWPLNHHGTKYKKWQQGF